MITTDTTRMYFGMPRLKQDFHGETGTRLYQCWRDMLHRSKKRDRKGERCEVYTPWLAFTTFMDWALQNGYADELLCCRSGDSGNYRPDNCRWDTRGNNSKEGLAEYRIMTSPEGEQVVIYNMNEFCREHRLSQSAMAAVASGKSLSSKGWTQGMYQSFDTGAGQLWKLSMEEL